MIGPIGNDKMIVIFFYYKAFLFHKKCLQTLQTIKKKLFFCSFQLRPWNSADRELTDKFCFIFLGCFFFLPLT